MWRKSLCIPISLFVLAISGGLARADCPPADFTSDCFVDFEDFAVFANHWLTGDPNTLVTWCIYRVQGLEWGATLQRPLPMNSPSMPYCLIRSL